MNICAQCCQRMLFGGWVVCCLLLTVRSADAATLTVTNLADSGPGTLRGNIAAAVSGDTIDFDPLLSGQTIVLTNGQIGTSKTLAIDASALSNRVRLSGAHQSRIFSLGSTAVVSLHSLELTDGVTNGAGGAIRSTGDLTLINCVVSNCTAVDGGAISAGGSGKVFLFGSLLSSNLATRSGGGVHALGADVILSNSVIAKCSSLGPNLNTGSDGGGAIYLQDAEVIISGSSIFRCQSAARGGAFMAIRTLGARITNSIIAENSAVVAGGLSCYGLVMRHSTVVGNSASNSAGGIRKASSSPVTIENSVVTGNSAPLNPDFEAISESFTFVGSNLTNGNPLLAPLGDYGGPTPTMPPLPGSPVIDAAVLTAQTPPIDQRGAPRPNGALPDIGAVEAFAFSSLTLVDTDNDGIDDRLEPAYGLVVGNDDSTADSDGDGHTDAAEIFSMTNPLDANDHLRILDIMPAAGFDPSTNPLVSVTLATFPGLGYVWESGTALTNFQTMSNGQFTATNSLHVQGLLLQPDQGFLRVRRVEP